jgi:hypothetical protein
MAHPPWTFHRFSFVLYSLLRTCLVKLPTATVETGAMQKSRNRQTPSSCEPCRASKLKCDRVHPCSNCTARGKDCVFLVPPQKRQNLSGTSADRSHAELWERVKRLEALVLPRSSVGSLQDTAPSDSVPGSPVAGTASSKQQQDQDQALRVLDDVGTGDGSMV